MWTVEGGGTATIEGAQIGEIVTTRGTREATCETATITGTVENGSGHATATPTLTNCHTIILGTKFPITITMNGCFGTTELTSDFVAGQHTYTAIGSLICPEGKTVETHVYSNHTNHTNNTSLCTYTIPGSSEGANQNLKHTDVTNEPAGGPTPKNWLLGHITGTGEKSIRHGGEFTCGPKEANVEAHGTGSLKAKKGAEDVGLTVSTAP